MNTLKWLLALVAIALVHLAPSVSLAAGQPTVCTLVAMGVVGQTTGSKADDRKAVEGLMARAREAIEADDLETADTLITQAEQLNVSFSVLHFGDTPKKLRAKLNAASRRTKRGSLKRPSQKFDAKLPNPRDEQPGKDASHSNESTLPTASVSPDDEAPLLLPKSEGRLRELPGPQHVVSSPTNEKRLPTGVPRPTNQAASAANSRQAQAGGNRHLLAARKALAVGDVRRATASLETAKQIKMNYGPHDDSPAKVEAAIRDYRQVMELLNARQNSDAARHQLAGVLMDQAQQLMHWGEFDEAERLAHSVESLRVSYGPYELTPEAVIERIAAARAQRRRGGDAGKAALAAGGDENQPAAHSASQAVYRHERDTTQNAVVSHTEEVDVAEPSDQEKEGPSQPAERLPEPEAQPRPIHEPTASATELFRAGEQALRQGNTPKALEYFKQAYDARKQLDPVSAERLQDHLQMLAAPLDRRPAKEADSLIDAASEKQQLLAKQLVAEIAQKQIRASKIRQQDPKQAMELLKQARASVESSGLAPEARAALLRRVDRHIEELDKYILENRAEFELKEANKEVLDEIERRRQAKIEIDEKLAKLVDDFNKLMDQERFAEAEVVAKRARELAPQNPLVRQLMWQSRFVMRSQRNQDLKDSEDSGAWAAFMSAHESAVPFDDRDPYRMPNAKKWEELTQSRSKRMAEGRRRRSERELEIERKLKTPVLLKFRDAPLSEVLDYLAKVAAVNLHLDEKGLAEEGVSSDMPVTIDLTSEISLKSALNLILEPKHLSYVIQDEVLKVTSEQLRDGAVYQEVYNVADLVVPIPNFVPNGRTGLTGALAEAYNLTGGAWGGMGGVNGVGAGYLASADGAPAMGVLDPKLLAQMNEVLPATTGARLGAGNTQSGQFGPGGMGGGSMADFDTLIELITTTVKPQTWDEVGGPGTISQFPNNLSLVISQTQDVHEEIVDLLEQLRRNQDLQVTIEVRFITLSDNFFEQIGVDFNADVVNSLFPGLDPREAGNKHAVVGLNPGAPFPNYTTQLEIPFRQNSFNLAVPQFGQPVQVANFGFAILSDLQAYLLVNASQGDRRSNVLQAPKVTMFNGQFASVMDRTQQPFLISVIPVVGDFAAAYQPVITVLSEGTALAVQAVVSSDRRFVRLTVVPFFSQIGDVTEFRFTGSESTTQNTSNQSSTGGTSGDSTASTEDSVTTTQGVTIQLPSFSFVNVSTTVSVPDGGTVLLGGIKRLSEGRNEFGVPILSKLPYINRLFKNVGIGRETQSLMMMVTPRIIIQEEEEERLGITSGS